MEEVDDDVTDKPPPHNPRISVDPVDWFIKMAFLQAELIYTCTNSILSPVFTIFAVASESYCRAEEVRKNVGSTVQNAPSAVAHSSVLLVRRLGLGILAAAYVCLVLSVLMVVSVVIRVSLVEMLVEEPLFLNEKLHFDYTEIHPKAVLSFRGSGSGQGLAIKGGSFIRRKHAGIPAGHTVVVSLVLEMPESDYNLQIGIFQWMDESSAHAEVQEPAHTARPDIPSRAAPPARSIRQNPEDEDRSPIAQGRVSEIRSHQDRFDSAGRNPQPQVIYAEMVISSQLPWTKVLLYNWKWTFYLWSSIYTYTLLLLVLLCSCRWLVLTQVARPREEEKRVTRDGEEEKEVREAREGEMEELMRRWEQRRKKRKAILMSESRGGGGESSVVTVQHSQLARTCTHPWQTNRAFRISCNRFKNRVNFI